MLALLAHLLGCTLPERGDTSAAAWVTNPYEPEASTFDVCTMPLSGNVLAMMNGVECEGTVLFTCPDGITVTGAAPVACANGSQIDLALLGIQTGREVAGQVLVRTVQGPETLGQADVMVKWVGEVDDADHTLTGGFLDEGANVSGAFEVAPEGLGPFE